MKTNVPAQRFVDAIRENKPDLVGMSSLLTTTTQAIVTTLEALTEAGLRDQVKVIVGGAPITQDFADKIDVDGFAPGNYPSTPLPLVRPMANINTPAMMAAPPISC